MKNVYFCLLILVPLIASGRENEEFTKVRVINSLGSIEFTVPKGGKLFFSPVYKSNKSNESLVEIKDPPNSVGDGISLYFCAADIGRCIYMFVMPNSYSLQNIHGKYVKKYVNNLSDLKGEIQCGRDMSGVTNEFVSKGAQIAAQSFCIKSKGKNSTNESSDGVLNLAFAEPKLKLWIQIQIQESGWISDKDIVNGEPRFNSSHFVKSNDWKTRPLIDSIFSEVKISRGFGVKGLRPNSNKWE